MSGLTTWVRLERGGDGETNISTLLSAAGSYLSGFSSPYARLLLLKDGTDTHTYLTYPAGRTGDLAVENFARAIGATPRPCEEVEPSPAHWFTLKARRFHNLDTSITASGADPFAAAEAVARALDDGACVEVCFRRTTRLEKNKYRKFIRLSRSDRVTHYFLQSQHSLCASVAFGTGSKDEAQALADTLVASWPGFDIATRVVSLRARARAMKALLLLCACAFLALGFTPGILPQRTVGVSLACAGVALACIAGALLVKGVYRPSSPPMMLRMSHTRTRMDMTEYPYPIALSTLALSPLMIAGLARPTGRRSALQREAPSALYSPIGPVVGRVRDTGIVHLSARDYQQGAAIVGSPGSGKTVFLQSLVAQAYAGQARPHPGSGEEANAVIVFEIKQQSALEYARIHERVASRLASHPNPLWLITPADRYCDNGIDLFPADMSDRDRAAMITDALVAEAGSEWVGPASRETLMSVFLAACLVDEAVLDVARTKTENPLALASYKSFVYYAYLLLTGASDEVGVALAEAIMDKARMMGEGGAEALAHISTLYGPRVTATQRANAVRAPRNKLARLIDVDWIFSHVSPSGKRKPSWEWILDHAHNVVVQTTGDGVAHADLSDDHERIISVLYAYTLHRTIQRHCGGWAAHNKWVTPVFDELSVIGASSPEIVEWARNKGRSYGVRPLFATQNPRQLETRLRETLLTFSTFVSFKADDADISADIAARLGADGNIWQSYDIYNLPVYHAAIHTRIDGTSIPAFTVETLYWADNECFDLLLSPWLR